MKKKTFCLMNFILIGNNKFVRQSATIFFRFSQQNCRKTQTRFWCKIYQAFLQIYWQRFVFYRFTFSFINCNFINANVVLQFQAYNNVNNGKWKIKKKIMNKEAKLKLSLVVEFSLFCSFTLSHDIIIAQI